MAFLAMFPYETALGTWVLILFLIKMGWPVRKLVRNCLFLPLGVCISTLGSKPSRGGSLSCPCRLSVWIGKGLTPFGYRFRTRVICNPLGGGAPPRLEQLPAAPVLGLDGEVLSPTPLHPPGFPPDVASATRGVSGVGMKGGWVQRSSPHLWYERWRFSHQPSLRGLGFVLCVFFGLPLVIGYGLFCWLSLFGVVFLVCFLCRVCCCFSEITGQRFVLA